MQKKNRARRPQRGLRADVPRRAAVRARGRLAARRLRRGVCRRLRRRFRGRLRRGRALAESVVCWREACRLLGAAGALNRASSRGAKHERAWREAQAAAALVTVTYGDAAAVASGAKDPAAASPSPSPSSAPSLSPSPSPPSAPSPSPSTPSPPASPECFTYLSRDCKGEGGWGGTSASVYVWAGIWVRFSITISTDFG